MYLCVCCRGVRAKSPWLLLGGGINLGAALQRLLPFLQLFTEP